MNEGDREVKQALSAFFPQELASTKDQQPQHGQLRTACAGHSYRRQISFRAKIGIWFFWQCVSRYGRIDVTHGLTRDLTIQLAVMPRQATKSP